MINKTAMKIVGTVVLVFTAAVLAACGGGGGGTSTYSSGGTSHSSSSSSVVSSVSGWVSGVFQPSSTFANSCQSPRTGIDSEGNAFSDKQGTQLDEKNWLRSWTHEIYLWNTEVTDTDPSLFTGSTIDYFNILKTNAATASGKAKDGFHFSEATADYLAEEDSAATVSYGATFAAISVTVPRKLIVAFTDPDTPASTVVGGVTNLVRGTEILSVNGVDLVNGGTTQAEVNILNEGIFAPVAGTTYTFTVRDPGSSTIRTINLTAQNLTPKPVNRTRILTDGSGNKVGYILFNTFSPFSSESDIVNAMQTMQTANVKDLVLDLRYNGGGLLAVASELSYMVAGSARTSGHIFEKLNFNSAAGTLNPVTGAANTPTPFYDTAVGFSLAQGTALPALNLPRVFVLTTDETCSASEAVINGLRGVGVDVVQVGGETCGKPYGFYPQDNCGTTYFSIQFQGVNDVGFGDYADGFTPANSTVTSGVKIPGCAVADDYNHDLGDSSEALLSAALGYGSSGTCPAAAISARTAALKLATLPSIVLKKPDPPFMAVNQDIRMPGRP